MEQQATITQLTFLITVALSVMVLVFPRKYMLLPYVIGACWVPADQTIMVGELNFQVLRVLIVMGVLRLYVRGEVVPIRWNKLDKLVLAWALVGSLVYVLQWMNMAALINRCGRLLEWLGLYWVSRQSLRSWDDIGRAYMAFAVCAIAMVPFVALEWSRGDNPFAALGRVGTSIREGNYRCQATFPHSIMMGLFWATLVPLFIGFSRQKYKLLFWAAVAASAFMIVATNSSTPILTLMAVGAMLAVYKWRSMTGTVAWGIVAMLFALHIVMKAPVWHLVARIGVVSGSTGYHRFNLIDNAIRHFSEWMVLGIRGTGHWGYGLDDITNQFILEGVRGGLITLVLFCAILFVGARALVRLSLRSRDKNESYLAWCTFVTIIAHVISFIGVSYFGQITMIWYLLLASAGLFYGRVEELQVSRQPAIAGRLQRA
ncbi:MAG: O-antigen ligase family protein [Solirubrobacterales bacterium]